MIAPKECWLWRGKNFEDKLGAWEACLGFKPKSQFGGNEYIRLVPAPGEPQCVVAGTIEYTSLNDLKGFEPYEVVINLDPTKYMDFYRNRDGNFAYHGEDGTFTRRPRFFPGTFFKRPEVKGVHLTPFNTVVIVSEGKTYHLPVTSDGTELVCRDVWLAEGDDNYSQVHVLRLPHDHPATRLFGSEEKFDSTMLKEAAEA